MDVDFQGFGSQKPVKRERVVTWGPRGEKQNTLLTEFREVY